MVSGMRGALRRSVQHGLRRVRCPYLELDVIVVWGRGSAGQMTEGASDIGEERTVGIRLDHTFERVRKLDYLGFDTSRGDIYEGLHCYLFDDRAGGRSMGEEHTGE